MPNKIKPRRSYTANAVPVVSGPTPEIEQHEMAVNWTDGKLFTRDANNQLVSITLGGSGSIPTASASVLGGVKVGGGLTITDGVLAATGGGSGLALAEHATTAQFPATGVAGTLYCATDAGRLYRWTGSVYAELGSVGGEDTTLRALFVPPAPTGVTATAGNAQATVSWTAPAALSTLPITDYTVQFSTNSGSTWTTFARSASTATSATVTGLTNGTAVVFRVAAVNGAGTGSPSAATSSVTPTSGDPFFASVALLLHADGTGSTFVDSSLAPKTITAVGNATQSATQSKWGGKSAFFTGTSRLSSSTSSAFAFGTGDFCVEMWVYPSGTSAFQTLFSTRSSNTGEDSSNVFFGFNTGTLTPIVYTNGLVLSGSSSLSAGTWSHIAFVRESGVVSIYLNGTRIGNTSFTTSITGTNASVGLTQNSEHQFSGYIDDVRVTSSSRYTGTTITVPTAAFPDA
jgi:hypothetical protein